jgi:hypothetical protein
MKLTLILAAVLLTGCSSTKMFANIPACGLDGKQAYVVSMWGRIGIASPLTHADLICK